jgi:hypothetical protein
MSNEKTPETAGPRGQAEDTAILIAWIAGLLIFAAIFWALSQPVRNTILIRAVNRVLEEAADSRRLEEHSTYGRNVLFGMGTWFNMTSLPGAEEKQVFVFSFIGEGTFFPCAAVINNDGKVEEFIPLNKHGERIINRISPGILRIYARRIEGIIP